MRVLIAPDKFKGSLTAVEAAAAIADGVRRVRPDAEVDLCPLSDGGEGFVDTVVRAAGGTYHTARVTGPLPEMRVSARFGMLEAVEHPPTAVLEMSAASGLALLKAEDRNPLHTTTFGTGELLLHAAKLGARRVLLGIGGSATNDAGVGCCQGAGLTVLMRDGSPVSMTEPLCARDLDEVLTVKHARGSPVDRVAITAACDVTNPLFGPVGAARVFGPQKGASPEDVEELDRMLRDFASRTGKLAEADAPGAGAAGGLGFGLLAFFNADLRPGLGMVMDAVGFEARVRGADLVITGEGRLDASSLHGKVPAGVAEVARRAGVPCLAVAGQVDEVARGEVEPLFARVGTFPPLPLDESFARAGELLRNAAAEAVASSGR